MYKLLLSSRYLRTRFIALASIISVMLGVATMIVVNSVMAGFSTQMKDRLHGILADMMVKTQSTDGTESPAELMELIDGIAGEYIAAMTPTVEIYGMMTFEFGGQQITQPVTLIGIVPEGKDMVSPIREYLMNYQRITEDGRVVRPPLHGADHPLDWELTEDAIAHRELWLERERFRAQIDAMDARPDQPFGDPFRGAGDPAGEPLVGETPPSSEADHVNPFSGWNDQDGVAAAGMSPAGMFGTDPEPAEPADPNAARPARVYVGVGLISIPVRDPETGQTRTMMMVAPGEDVRFTTVTAGTPPGAARFAATVVDVFKSGMSEYDANLVFVNLEELQFARKMLLTEERGDWTKGSVTSVQIRLHDYDDAPQVARLLLGGLPTNEQFLVRTWEQEQGPLLQAVEVESAILNVLLFLIIAVAGFGILAIFYMIVVEKTRDIGILKALGASSTGIMSIFLSYGLGLGIVGSGVGVGLGLLFVHYINEIEDLLSWITGKRVFDETIYYFHEIPTAVNTGTVLWVATGAMLIAVLASVLPARRASRLDPVRALRYE